MKKYDKLAVCGIILVFILFSLFHIFKKDELLVLQVNSPFSFVVDKNNNANIDDGEEVNIDFGDYNFITKDNISDKGWKSLNLDDTTKWGLVYLTDKYVKDLLFDKKVLLKETKNGYAVYVKGQNYNDIILKSGYVFNKYTPVNKALYNKRLEQTTKNNYVLHNAKSGKYHRLTCKYAHKAHNFVIVPKSQLPKDAKACKFCFSDAVKHKKSANKKKNSPNVPSLVISQGSIKVILNDYTKHLTPNRRGNSNMCNELVKQINATTKTIDIAIYGYDTIPKVENALKKAQKRGVKIRLVYDIDSNNSNIYANTFEFVKLIDNAVCDRINNNIPNAAQYTNSFMHNKFFIFDNERVITGSANLSYTDMSDFNSNAMILINSKVIANIYTQEFEQMYNSKFHNLKAKIPNKNNIMLGSQRLSVYFSPSDETIKNMVVPLVDNAKKYIYMPVFLITDKRLAQALINAKNRGVDIRVVVDATNARSPYSKHRLLRQHGILVKTENYAGKLHSKSIIIDDEYTIIGSMNFSKNGELKNDENVVLIKDKTLAIFYKKFFDYLWARINDYWLTHDVSAESVYSFGSCSDGIDNDYDGKIDSLDEGCQIKVKKLFN